MMKQKSMLKKGLVLCLAGVMVFGLAACGEKAENASSGTTSTPPAASETKKESKAENLGKFEATDLEGNKVTQEVFQENDLTMVNVFSSTCNPCMEELPHLADLASEYKDKKVGVLGVNIDTDASGKPDEQSKKVVAQVLSKSAGDMKIIFWDAKLMDALLKKTDALPYTFFVDKEGNVVGEAYLGDRAKADWEKIVDTELKNVGGK